MCHDLKTNNTMLQFRKEYESVKKLITHDKFK
jgi:hypothetical protein